MNKKKLALTLLLSSMSVSVVADDVVTKQPIPETHQNVELIKKGEDGVVIHSEKRSIPAGKEQLPDAKVVLGADGKPVTPPTPPTPTTPGYFASAWSAVKSHQVMTAALVTTCILLGAVVHAAVVSNNEVDADDAE